MLNKKEYSGTKRSTANADLQERPRSGLEVDSRAVPRQAD
jgi:hypothetical protein